MKKGMFAMVAALSFAVVAQDAEGPKARQRDGGFRHGPRDRGAMMAERGMMMPGGFGGELKSDPAVMAATNPKIAEKIGLSAEACEQIKKLDTDNRAKVQELQKKTRELMEKQAQLMKAEKIDEAAVMAAIDELFECRKEMAKTQTKRLISVKSLLTPEQIKQATEAMKELRNERMAKRAKRSQKDGNMGGARPEAKSACKQSPKGDCEKPAVKPEK